jgi:putative transposase
MKSRVRTRTHGSVRGRELQGSLLLGKGGKGPYPNIKSRKRRQKGYMTHSYRLHYFHLIWSTKKRLPQISSDVQSRLYSYLAVITKNHSVKLLEIGGTSDHIHLLIEFSLLDRFSYFIRDLKASSSLWIHNNFPHLHDFSWQEGYGSFSVSYSSLEGAKTYIQNQEHHHATMSFEEEYLKFLKLHRVKYDERFVLG